MVRTLEALFRQPLRILCILILPPLIGLAIIYFLPRSYQTTATIWALRRYSVIGATGSESNLLASPADTQASALSELLQSRIFALAVAHDTKLASELNVDANDPLKTDDALFDEISHQVQVAPVGYNLLSISYTNRNANVAQEVVAAVIKYYGQESHSFAVAEGQRLLDSYQTQYDKAKQDRDAAVVAETSYLLGHPDLKEPGRDPLASDPQYALLHNQTQHAQATLDNLQNTINTIKNELNVQGPDANSLFKVVDEPQVSIRPVAKTKLFLFGGGSGLALGLLACGLYLVMLVRRDRGIHTKNDLTRVTSVPVIMQLPRLEITSVSSLIE